MKIDKEKILLGLIVLMTGLTFYFFRFIFIYKYESEYYENWFYHSQWNIPQSTRGISDGELYKFVGYRLAEGENPFNINYETPPLAKWLYGLAELYLGNPYWVSGLMYLISIGLVYKLLKKVIKDKWKVLLATLLYVTTPFVATQVRETMMDLPLMFFCLWQIWWFWEFLETKKWRYLILAGFFLGLATGVKPPVYTPIIGLLGLLIVLITSKKILNGFWYIGATIAGYLGAWFCYFIKHPNPIPWMRLHEKSISFYLSPEKNIDYLNQWRGIFLNVYQGWWGVGSTGLGDWSIILPVGVIVLMIVLIKAFKLKDYKFIYLGGVILTFLGVNTIIPFWSRYLMPIIPLLVIVIGHFFQKKWLIICLLIAFSLPVYFISLNPNNVSGDAGAVARFISTRAYRELYRSIDYRQRKTINESEFVKMNEDLIEKLSVLSIDIKMGGIKQEKNQAMVDYEIVYNTSYGKLTQRSKIEFTRFLGQWRMKWRDDYLLAGWSGKSQLIVEPKTIPLKIILHKGEEIAKRSKWYEVYIIPRLMFDWTKALDQLNVLTGERNADIENRIRRVVPADFRVFVGYLNVKLGETGVKQALAVKGVSLKEIDYPLLGPKYRDDNNFISMIRELKNTKPELFVIEATGKIVDELGREYSIPFPIPEKRNVILNY